MRGGPEMISPSLHRCKDELSSGVPNRELPKRLIRTELRMGLQSSRRNLAAELARNLVVFGLEIVLIDTLDLKAHLGAYSHVVPYQKVGKFFSVDQDDTFWTLRAFCRISELADFWD